MKSFVLACIAIVIIGVAAHFVTDRYGPSIAENAPNPSVRLD